MLTPHFKTRDTLLPTLDVPLEKGLGRSQAYPQLLQYTVENKSSRRKRELISSNLL